MMVTSCVTSGVAPPTIVIAGLDPAIQPSAGALPDPMDARVKPAHDNERLRGALCLSTALAMPDSTGLDPGINNRHCFAVPYWVYILASRKKGTLYVGVTRDLARRVFQHRERETHGFTSRYAVIRLVRYEQYDDPRAAIQRERNLKHWSRDWKIALIENANPDWRDRYAEITA